MPLFKKYINYLRETMVNKTSNLIGYASLPCLPQEDKSREHDGCVELHIHETSREQKRMRQETVVQKNVANLKAVTDPKQKEVFNLESIYKAEKIVIDQLYMNNKITYKDIELLKLYRDLERNRPLIEMGNVMRQGIVVPNALQLWVWEIQDDLTRLAIALFTETQRESYRQARVLIENEFIKYACHGLNPDGTPGEGIAISRIADICKPGVPASKFAGTGFINGMANEFTDAEEYALIISGYAQAKIKLVYNATHGVVQDVLAAVMGKSKDSDPLDINERLLLMQWEEFFAAHGPDAKFHQICHSKGAIHVKNALRSAPQSIRERIVVTAIAPASIIVPGECLAVNNFASEKDTWLLKMHQELSPGNLKHVEILKASELAEGHDHSFASPTYQEKIIEMIELFDEKYGENK